MFFALSFSAQILYHKKSVLSSPFSKKLFDHQKPHFSAQPRGFFDFKAPVFKHFPQNFVNLQQAISILTQFLLVILYSKIGILSLFHSFNSFKKSRLIKFRRKTPKKIKIIKNIFPLKLFYYNKENLPFHNRNGSRSSISLNSLFRRHLQ